MRQLPLGTAEASSSQHKIFLMLRIAMGKAPSRSLLSAEARVTPRFTRKIVHKECLSSFLEALVLGLGFFTGVFMVLSMQLGQFSFIAEFYSPN